MTETSWLLEPRDPLVVRDGRPNSGRSESRVLGFPLPSTIAGGVRTRLGSGPRGFEMQDRVEELLGVSVRGPLLVDATDPSRIFVPAPTDAVIFVDSEAGASVRAVTPSTMPEGVALDADLGDLLPLVLRDEASGPSTKSGKPSRQLTYWPWRDVEDWLSGAFARGVRASSAADLRELFPEALGPLERESRVHVAIGATGTAVDGQLFETEGLRLHGKTPRGSDVELALRVEAGALEGRKLSEGIGPLGGERRLVRWCSTDAPLPTIPVWLRQAAREGTRTTLRVLLVTPAIFAGGFQPSDTSPLLRPREGLRSKLIAASVGQPLTVSGWSLRDRKPKPSRRAANAGSVYWVELEGDADAREAWLEEVWMQNVSCDEQDRRDGWGLAALGVAS